jgi:hypothetical protein
MAFSLDEDISSPSVSACFCNTLSKLSGLYLGPAFVLVLKP